MKTFVHAKPSPQTKATLKAKTVYQGSIALDRNQNRIDCKKRGSADILNKDVLAGAQHEAHDNAPDDKLPDGDMFRISAIVCKLLVVVCRDRPKATSWKNKRDRVWQNAHQLSTCKVSLDMER